MNKSIVRKIAVSVMSVMAMTIMLSACKKNEYRVVKVETYAGEVSVVRDDDGMEVFEGMKLVSDDVVTVGDESSLELLVDSDKHLYASENTRFELVATGSIHKGAVEINILDGSALIAIDNKLEDESTFSVSTPNAVFSVRGTQFVVTYDATLDITALEVIEGVVATEYDNGASGEMIEAGDGRVVSGDEIVAFTDWTGPSISGVTTGGAGSGGDDGNGDSSDNTFTDANSDTVIAAYNDVIVNMNDFVSANTTLNCDEYYGNDYMYYDYDQDGCGELILYLRRTGDDLQDYLDLVFLDYDEDSEEVVVSAINRNDIDTACFYADYNGKLARYSWLASASESYIYTVNYDGDVLCYIFEEEFDEIIVDFDSVNLRPLPLHGDWERIHSGLN